LPSSPVDVAGPLDGQRRRVRGCHRGFASHPRTTFTGGAATAQWTFAVHSLRDPALHTGIGLARRL
jgi:hypothetical protein